MTRSDICSTHRTTYTTRCATYNRYQQVVLVLLRSYIKHLPKLTQLYIYIRTFKKNNNNTVPVFSVNAQIIMLRQELLYIAKNAVNCVNRAN